MSENGVPQIFVQLNLQGLQRTSSKIKHILEFLLNYLCMDFNPMKTNKSAI